MLVVEDITKRYHYIQALSGISLEVSRGEILTILGPSGCGKTTLLRVIAGFERPDEGKVLIDGLDVSSPEKMTPVYKRNLSMIFQDLALWPHMNVIKHISFVMDKDRSPRSTLEEKIQKVLKKVNLSGYDNRYPNKLSGGEKQRLAIARALASNPAYLLMDEPFTNLDHMLKDELHDVIVTLKDNAKMGIIYVTHNIEEAVTIADRMVIMNQGRIEQIGSKEDVLSNPINAFVELMLKVKESQ